MSSVGLGLSGSIKAGAWAAPCCGAFWRKPSLVPDPPGRRGVSSTQWLPANFLAEASTRLTACTHVSLWLGIVVFLTVSGCCFVFVTYLLFIYFFMDLFIFICCSFACVEPSKPATALNYAARLLLKRLKIPACQGQHCTFSVPLLCAIY